jgi:hypothetical protein
VKERIVPFSQVGNGWATIPRMTEQAKSPSDKQASDLKEKAPTAEDFITKWPLYTPFPVDGRFDSPDRVSLQCLRCAKETTWLRGKEETYQLVEGGDGFYWVAYNCGLCESAQLLVVYRNSEFKKVSGASPGSTRTVATKIRKIGQAPPLSVSIPPSLEKNLGATCAALYKKALVNRNEGYGLGAVTYIRRVVEDKTDELIEVVSQLAEAHNVESEIVGKIRAAKNERSTYDNKLRIAATVLPASLVIDGVNPLGELYDLVSEGVHDLTEEECIAVADETKSVFEFTFTNLRAETKVRQEFVAKVKKWAGGKGAKKDGDGAAGD